MVILNTQEDIFSLPRENGDIVVIPTNGIVNSRGNAVMGKGMAKQADDLYGLSGRLGLLINKHGNNVYILGIYRSFTGVSIELVSFPTKHHYRQNADIGLIEKSARQLAGLADGSGYKNIYLPPVGCGLGNLNWEIHVKPILENIFDDRFKVVMRSAK